MKLAYPVSTPEVTSRVLAWQGNLATIAPALADMGYAGVELFVRDPSAFPLSPLEDALARAGLAVAAIGTGPLASEDRLTFTDRDPGVRAAALARACSVVDLAAQLGSQVNVGKLRGMTGHDPRAASWRDDALHALHDHAARRGVCVTLEPQHRGIIDNLNHTASAIAWVEAMGLPHLRLMLDSFHIDAEEASLPAAVKAARTLVLHAHVADSGRQVPGRGRIDIAGFLRALREVGYARFITVEVEQLPDSAAAAHASAGYLHPLLGTNPL